MMSKDHLLINQELIKQEVNSLILNTKSSLDQVKRIAIGEAWKILQLATASVVQIIEKLGQDLKNPDKKALAMDLLNKFYDDVFIIVDIPVVPNVFEPIIHRYIKKILMIMVASSIDATVTIFRETGIFLKKGMS